MKTSTTITLDIEVLTKVRDHNMNLSKFINDTIIEYFDMQKEKKGSSLGDVDMEIAQMAALLSELKAKKEELEKIESKRVVLDV